MKFAIVAALFAVASAADPVPETCPTKVVVKAFGTDSTCATEDTAKTAEYQENWDFLAKTFLDK